LNGSSAPASAVPAKGPLPLVIGVVGHRHLESHDLPLYRSRIGAFFDEMHARYPSTPLRVLSALAEGSDRLVAEVALARGCELLVPLPMAPEEYEKDFPASVEQFRGLLARVPADNAFVLQPPRAEPGMDAQQLRDLQYLEVGVYVSAQSHILLALWDGVRNKAVAGTAEVVRFKLEGQTHSDDRALDADDCGPIYCIHAPRAGSGDSADVAPVWMYPRDSSAEILHTVCSRIDRFNRDALRIPVSAAQAADASGLLPDIKARPPADQRLAETFASADTLARGYQRLTHTVLRVVIGLAVALALTFEIYA
jgi:hypothetical protein